MIGYILYNGEQITVTTPYKKVAKLTTCELELTEYFYQNKNKRIKKEESLIRIWGENDYFLGRSLDVFISRLRKIFAQSKKISLNNLCGAGCIFNVEEV